MSEEAIIDLAVIGGGVNGCAIARDAAGRGASVVLFEAGDLARGTSSASTKLIHGGLRYLEHYEFALVREALAEREVLLQIAPHIAHPLRFVLPWAKGLRPRWLLRLGLFLYDHLSARRTLPGTETVNLAHHPAGSPLKPGFSTAFVYSDGWVDDARLVVLTALDAAERGAQVHTRCAVTGLAREDGLWRIESAAGVVRARAVVNAAGPGVLAVLATAKQRADHPMRLVRGSHIVVPKQFDHPYAYFFQLPDGRIFFAIPYERDFTLIGTTDRDHTGSLDAVHASEEEIVYLCEGASSYFARAITPADVVCSYAGVRPLLDDGSGRPEAASRGYSFEVEADAAGKAPLLSVFGGKITTHRHLALDAVSRLSPFLPALAGPGWTHAAPLPGGDFAGQDRAAFAAALGADYPFLDSQTCERLAAAYGTRARNWLGAARAMADLGADFGHGLTGAEVDYLIAREWARTAEDVLWRRTKLGLRFSEA